MPRRRPGIITKIHAALITAGEYQTHDYYMNIGPTFADPVARQLYAEIASVEEQHVTQYGSLQDPTESYLEKWLIQEAMEVYLYASCAQQESNPRIRAIWERFLDYEQGHLQRVSELFKQYERRDPHEVLAGKLPANLLEFKSHREFVRAQVLAEEVDLRTNGTQYVPKAQEGASSLSYREHMNSDGVPAMMVSAGYEWRPGTELNRKSRLRS